MRAKPQNVAGTRLALGLGLEGGPASGSWFWACGYFGLRLSLGLEVGLEAWESAGRFLWKTLDGFCDLGYG